MLGEEAANFMPLRGVRDIPELLKPQSPEGLGSSSRETRMIVLSFGFGHFSYSLAQIPINK